MPFPSWETPPVLVIPSWQASQNHTQVKARHLGVPGEDPLGSNFPVVFLERLPPLTTCWVASGSVLSLRRHEETGSLKIDKVNTDCNVHKLDYNLLAYWWQPR